MGLIAASLLTAILITAQIDVWKVPYVLAIIVARLIYTAKIGGHRLKDIPTSKKIHSGPIVGSTWYRAGRRGWSIFAFFFLWAFNNSIICDIRDVIGDKLHGVRTILVVLGAERSRLVLVILTSVMRLLPLLSLLSVTAISYEYMRIYSQFQEGLVDCGWLVIIGIYRALLQVIHILTIPRIPIKSL
jgi:4-hydroxybenzoate polyprenyltransferase